jgi:nucleoside 2-deoxyribosyltransferase
MKIYVAGKWEDKPRVREVQNYLKRFGHTITHDWTTESCGDDEEKWKEHARDDKAGVLAADAFVGVFEKDLRYSGALSEFGMACALGIPCYILGSAINGNVFLRLPEVHRGLEGLIGEYSNTVSNQG